MPAASAGRLMRVINLVASPDREEKAPFRRNITLINIKQLSPLTTDGKSRGLKLSMSPA